MAAKTEYADVPLDCLFIPPVEWSLLESYLNPEKLAEYAQTGYPRIDIEELPYGYMPLEINGKGWKVIAGERPIKNQYEI